MITGITMNINDQNIIEPDIITVKELTLKIKSILESSEFFDLNVSGEISNCSFSQSGHFYFNLKEVGVESSDQYILKGIIWNSNFNRLKLNIKDGDKVICHGKLSLYPPSGEYRLIVDNVSLSGEGLFWKRFMELKDKLFREGLFEAQRKKPIPEYPCAIGIITSEKGAALHDIINTIKTRAGYIDLYIFPVLVQGDQAASMIASAIQFANKNYSQALDVLILARGGGSLEDLWPFNEEIVARAIADSKIPIISGVGHETDFTIADFVADFRAPTPTGAATIVTQGGMNAKNAVINSRNRLLSDMARVLSRYKERVSLTFFQKRAINIIQSKIDNKKITLDNFLNRLQRQSISLFKDRKSRLESVTRLLNTLSVENILKKGYSITLSEDGKIISDINKIFLHQNVRTIISNGYFESTIDKISRDDYFDTDKK